MRSPIDLYVFQWKGSILCSYLEHFPAQTPQKLKKFTPKKILYTSRNETFLV